MPTNITVSSILESTRSSTVGRDLKEFVRVN